MPTLNQEKLQMNQTNYQPKTKKRPFTLKAFFKAILPAFLTFYIMTAFSAPAFADITNKTDKEIGILGAMGTPCVFCSIPTVSFSNSRTPFYLKKILPNESLNYSESNKILFFPFVAFVYPVDGDSSNKTEFFVINDTTVSNRILNKDWNWSLSFLDDPESKEKKIELKTPNNSTIIKYDFCGTNI